MVENTMKHASRRYILTLCLLIPLALLAASCGGGSDRTTSEDPSSDTPRQDISPFQDYSEDSASDDRGDPQSDSQNNRGPVSRENNNPQNEDPDRATAITAGGGHTCALRQTGTIKCWGDNSSGQLGNGQSTGGDWEDDSADSSVPVEVEGITDATAITAGISHTCALRQTGTITCWGDNRSGQLGNGQRGADEYSSVPVEVEGITDATAITAGGGHTCALRQTGTIKCWGSRKYGADSSVPVEVEGITDATAITAGTFHTCALRQTGTITCWGDNRSGQLGNGQRGADEYSSVPVEVEGITDTTTITTGGGHTCALRQTGTIKCWGSNWAGQLGNGQNTGDLRDDSADSSVPVEVEGITDATTITASEDHTCALRQTGTIKCWGGNWAGQLGNGQNTGGDWEDDSANSSVPIEVEGITDATAITSGILHTCALRQTGTITCWGNNRDGQLGNGAFLPQDVVGFGG